MTPYRVVFSPEAATHLEKIELYLAKRFYPVNARRFIERLTSACRSLANAPYRGTTRNDLRPGIRTIGFEHRATIYFKVVEQNIFIISVLYGGRQKH